METLIKARKLTKNQLRKYRRLKRILTLRSRLNARLAKLDEKKDELSEYLDGVFGDEDIRRINQHILLERKNVPVDAAVVDRAAYSYILWNELED